MSIYFFLFNTQNLSSTETSVTPTHTQINYFQFDKYSLFFSSSPLPAPSKGKKNILLESKSSSSRRCYRWGKDFVAEGDGDQYW